MSASRGIRYQVGVVGLGRLWEARHKPALARLQDRFKVVAVYDQVARRAALEAKNLNCAACLGLVELMERPDVDLIYLLTPQWFGLHAAELAALKGKPIYCGLPIASDPSGFEALATIVKDRKVPFMLELARRFYPVTLRLRELLATTLGEPKLVLGQSRLFGFDRYGQPGPTTQNAPVSLLVDPGSYLVDWCRFVFQSDPVRLQGFGALGLPSQGQNPSPTPPGDFASLHLEFPMGKTAQIEVTRYDAKSWGDATRFLPCRAFKSTQRTAWPSWKCQTGSNGPIPGARTKNACRSSQPWGKCSTTSSTGWSGAIIRWRLTSKRPWPWLDKSPSCTKAGTNAGSWIVKPPRPSDQSVRIFRRSRRVCNT